MKRPTTEERPEALESLTRNFRTKVTVCECGCWLFDRVDRYGYGSFKLNARNVVAHRWAYEHLIGPIPTDHDLDHLNCTLHCCVRPDHLQPVPKAENARRANATRWTGTKYDAEGNELTAASCPRCLQWAADRKRS